MLFFIYQEQNLCNILFTLFRIAPVVNRGDNVEHENYLESASEAS